MYFMMWSTCTCTCTSAIFMVIERCVCVCVCLCVCVCAFVSVCVLVSNVSVCILCAWVCGYVRALTFMYNHSRSNDRVHKTLHATTDIHTHTWYVGTLFRTGFVGKFVHKTRVLVIFKLRWHFSTFSFHRLPSIIDCWAWYACQEGGRWDGFEK